MPVIEQLDVALLETDSPRLLGASLQLPKAGGTSDGYAVKVAGWVLGRDVPVESVQAFNEGRVLQSATPHLMRPRVAARFPEADDAARTGFTMLVNTIGLTPTFKFRVRAVLADKTRVPLAVVSGQRRLLRSAFVPTLRPLMVTSLGRTGTTWLMRLLAEHPATVAYRRYPYEMRTGKYWMHMLRVLTEPADNTKPVGQPNYFHDEKSAIGPNPFYSASFAEYPSVEAWSGSVYPERLAAFCQQSAEEWYRRVAESQGQPEATYFAEKHLPDEYPPLIWELYPEARELFLVRDFRDVASSILAFNARRGFNDFGRDRAGSDEKFLQQLRHGASRLLESWQARAERSHLVRYEDLILRPTDTVRGILDYLGLDPTPAAVDGIIERASQETPELLRHQTSDSPVSSIGRWRRDLDPALQAVARETFDEILADFGYPPDA